MHITYDNRIQAFVVRIKKQGHMFMVAVNKSRKEAIKVGLRRIAFMRIV